MRPNVKLTLIALVAGAALFGRVPMAGSALTMGGMPTIGDLVEAGNVSNAERLLRSEYSFETRGGLLALHRFSILVLRQGLKESDPYERCYAATALVAYNDWSGRGVIADGLLDSTNPMIQKAVLEGVAEADNPAALLVLERFYRASGPVGRTIALSAMADVRDPTLMPIWIDAAKRPNSSDAFWAATGFGSVRDSDALAQLRLLLAKSTDPTIRVEAAHSLILQGDRSEAALQTVEQALHGENVAEASGAALALGDERNPAMAPILSEIESEPRANYQVQLAAAVALTHYGSSQGMPRLTAALSDQRECDFLMPMFDQLNFKLGRVLLIRAMSSADQQVRLAAIEAIGRNGGAPDAATLIESISSANDPMDVAQIAWSLGHIGGQNTITPLLNMVQNSAPAVRYTAADALAHETGVLLSNPATQGTEAGMSHEADSQ